MRVNEVFHSIQGEGVHNQVPMIFVRLQGCNLYPKGCLYCDTEKAQNPSGGVGMSVHGVINEAGRVRLGLACWWYCITGGEPLMQEPELRMLVNEIKGDRYTSKVEIETNGTLPPPKWFSRVDSWVVDIKTPSAGQHIVNQGVVLESWLGKLRNVDQLKFVVGTTEDLDFVSSILYARYFPSTVLISPIMDRFSLVKSQIEPGFTKEVVGFVLRYNLRLSVQVHKFLGVG